MKILITGKDGQLAQALLKKNNSKYNLISLSKDEFNLENPHGYERMRAEELLEFNLRPQQRYFHLILQNVPSN